MLNILVVDDSLVMRNKITGYIKDFEEYDIIETASNGKEAIALSKKLKPDIVTMDIAMPDMDGLTAVKHIKKDHPNIKIIMITSHGQEDMILSAISLGANAYLLKPIEKEKLKKVLHNVSLK